MSAQLEAVYDYMIKRGKKLKGHRLVRRDRLEYKENAIARVHMELSTRKGAVAEFAKHLVQQGLFGSLECAKDALRRYAQSDACARTIIKRTEIVSLYQQWNFVPVTKDINKWNEKLKKVWEEIL